MTNLALLNNVDHADLRVGLGHGAAFGDAVNQAPVFVTEFDEVQRDYPIVFRKDANGELCAVALLGLDRDENLFLDESGWHAGHVPAVVQRGPFSIGLAAKTVDGEERREPMIHVDLDDPRTGAADGMPVFLPHGGNSLYLQRVIRVLQVIHDGIELAPAMFAAFAEADLIEPVLLQIALDEHIRYDVPDCWTIGAERLARLDGAALERLNRAGFLRAAFLVVSSLGNVARLIERKNRKRLAAR